MHGDLKPIDSTPWVSLSLIVAALAACVPVDTPTQRPSPSALPTDTASPTRTPHPTPTPASTATHTLTVPTPTVTSTPIFAVTIKVIKMVDATTGWAEGHVGTEEATRILRTTDGGESWHDVSPALLESYGTQAFFLDAQLAWVRDPNPGVAWHTQDGGKSWTSVADLGRLQYIRFTDSLHGWKMEATSWGLTYRQFDIESFATTQDGGQTWQEIGPPPGYGSAYMAYPDEQMAWAIRAAFKKTLGGIPNLGLPFFIKTTADGGSTWTSYAMPVPPDTHAFEDHDGGTYLGGVGNCELVSPAYSSIAIWKLVLTCEDQGWTYTTANQGKTWIISPLPPGAEVVDIQFVNSTVGWLLRRDPLDRSQSRLYQTSNGGQSWTLLKTTGWTYAQLDFLDSQVGWAVACTDEHCLRSDGNPALVKTTDGGQTWRIIDPQIKP